MGSKTVIVIAHRLSTVAHLDRILVIDHGNIIEDGPRAELLRQRGAYSRLWSRQSTQAQADAVAASHSMDRPSAIGIAAALSGSRDRAHVSPNVDFKVPPEAYVEPCDGLQSSFGSSR